LPEELVNLIHQAQVIHHIPGRLRVKLPKAKGNYALLQQIKESISPRPGVKRVEVSATTGSVVVHYDPEMHEDYHTHLGDFAAHQSLFALQPPEITEADEIARKIEMEAEFLADHSDAARVVVNFVKQLNEQVKRATDNSVDLKVLLPLGLAIYTFIEAGTDAVTPLWVTLGIFSFNSFVNLHSHKGQVATEEHQVVFDQQSSQSDQVTGNGASGRRSPAAKKSRRSLKDGI
jgi:hypothetical protein